MAPAALHFTGNAEADALIARDPLALLIGFALDQQITVQTAFAGPLKLQQRLGSLDAGAIAATDPARLEELFRQPPAIHRFPGSMAKRVHDLCAARRDGVRRRRRAGLDGCQGREGPREADPSPARVRRHEGARALRGARKAARRRGGGAARTELPDARRRRLGRGARGLPGREARSPQCPSSRSYEGLIIARGRRMRACRRCTALGVR